MPWGTGRPVGKWPVCIVYRVSCVFLFLLTLRLRQNVRVYSTGKYKCAQQVGVCYACRVFCIARSRGGGQDMEGVGWVGGGGVVLLCAHIVVPYRCLSGGTGWSPCSVERPWSTALPAAAGAAKGRRPVINKKRLALFVRFVRG